jgi:hypothetical protein
MKQLLIMLAVSMVVSFSANHSIAQDKGGGKGKFVRLTEIAVGDREHLGIVVQPLERDAQITLLIPARPEGHAAELTAIARRLCEGQIFEFEFVHDGGHLWVRELGIPRDADAPNRRRQEAKQEEPNQLREQLRNLRERLHVIEQVMTELQAANARLRRELEESRQRRPLDKVEEPRRDAPPLPRRHGELHGTFLKHTEVVIGDSQFLAIVVSPAEGGEPMTLVAPRRNADLMEVARQWKEGQRVAIDWVEEEGKRWVRRWAH